VGVTVSITLRASGAIEVGVWVGTAAGIGDEVGSLSPTEVGVAYCPQREAFPPQDAIKKDAATQKMIILFTRLVRWWNYTCIKFINGIRWLAVENNKGRLLHSK